jgi:fermentation-respiration switch protein FrsA (DUF1100 family)
VRTALVVVVFLLLLAALLWTQQRKLMYFPSAHVPSPESLGIGGVEEVSFPTADGLTLNGWFISRSEQPQFTLIVFNGNAGNRAFRAPLAEVLARAGLAVLLFDYRGFGGNPGLPSEQGLRTDARAARDYLLTRPEVDRRRLVYFGESLGTAVAAELAVAHPPAALILRSPFTSMSDMARLHYGFLPTRWILRDRYATIDRVKRVNAPLMVIGGDADAIVPIAQTLQVYETASEPKELLVIEGAGHNDQSMLAGREMTDAVVRFLLRLPTA